MQKFLLSLILGLISHALFSQVTVSKEYNETPLSEVLKDIEDSYNVKLFYKDEWLADYRISQNLKDIELSKALSLILRPTDIAYEFLSNKVIILIKGEAQKQYSVKIEGYVTDSQSGEPVLGAIVRIPDLDEGDITNAEGFFSFEVPSGTYLITVKSFNAELIQEVHQMYEDKELSFEVFEEVTQLDDIVITTRATDENVTNPISGVATFNVESIKKLPNLLGEPDLSRIILSLPGVQSVGEGASGFNVRGGSIDQNLILVDNVPIYNSSHLLGFFSAFNPDLVSNFTIYKGNIPARFGGRLSSVVDIESKVPTSDKFKFAAGIGPITNKLSLNVPIINKRLATIVGGRYSNPTWILKSVDEQSINKSAASFYDLNVNVNFLLNEKNIINLSTYVSRDFYDFGSDTSFVYSNKALSLSWDHEFSKTIFGTFNAFTSDYSAELKDDDEFLAAKYQNGIQSNGVSYQLNYRPSDRANYSVGVNSKFTEFNMGKLTPQGNSSIGEDDYGVRNGIELAIYGNADHEFAKRLNTSIGLRVSRFAYKEENGFVFQADQPQSELTVIDTLNSGNYESQPLQFEPRISVNLLINKYHSIKLSVSRNAQYEHLFSNSTASLPTDLWLPTTNNLSTSISRQFSVGFFKNLKGNKYETSIEFYYKQLDNLNVLNTGREVLANRFIEADIIEAEGESRGLEFLIRKVSGDLTGWISYFYSRTQYVTDSEFPVEQINSGRKFFADFDRPHNANLSLNYQASRLWSLSANFVYSTGRPATVPNSIYSLNGLALFNPTSRNNIRTPDIHRLDLSFTLEGNNKKNSKFQNSFTFSIYNIYSRDNPFAVVSRAVNNTVSRVFKLSVLGNAIPSFTYNIKLK